MREIKFRLFDRETKEIRMVTAIDWDAEGNPLSCHSFTGGPESGYLSKKSYFSPPNSKAGEYGDDPILIQFTGLIDKNGTEIYEGDIVRQDILVGVVEYNAPVYMVYRRSLINNNYTCQMLNFDRKGEVIGNIHQNKELLESKS